MYFESAIDFWVRQVGQEDELEGIVLRCDMLMAM